MKKMIFLLLVLSAVSVLNANTGVARPQLRGKNLPAVWNSVSAAVRLQTLRVAQMDAYRALIERVYGFRLDSGSTVYDYVLESDRVRNAVDQELKGHAEMAPPTYDENGMVSVVYGIKMRKIIETITAEKSFDKVTLTKTLSRSDTLIEAGGYGALPDSFAMKMLRAKRAAELDAFRLMAERFAGVKITSRTTVADLCLESDRIQAVAIAFLKGLKPTSITFDEDGSCSVKLQLKIRETVETIEHLVKVYNSGAREKISSIDVSTNDKIFTVVGHGAPRDEIALASTAADIYKSEKVIFRRVIGQSVVVD